MRTMNKTTIFFGLIFLLQSVNATCVFNKDTIPVVYSLRELEAHQKEDKVNLRIYSIMFRLGYRDLDTNYQENIQFLDSLAQLIKTTDGIKSIEVGIHFARSIDFESLSIRLDFMYEGIIDYLRKKEVEEVSAETLYLRGIS